MDAEGPIRFLPTGENTNLAHRLLRSGAHFEPLKRAGGNGPVHIQSNTVLRKVDRGTLQAVSPGGR